MTVSLTHRGPDAGDYWQSPDAVANLGHRRLSVIDLTPTGAQPMQTPDGRFVLSYNGEIYNFLDLRRELEAAGLRFRGTSDTEVLLNAVVHWGVESTLRRLNGMFAFALWDAENRSLYLARDRFGEKPLYYGWHDGTLLFGSELKALAAHPAFRREIEPEAVALFMRFSYVPWPHSIFRHTWKLGPGHFVEVKPGEPPLPPRPYWDVTELIQKRQQVNLHPEDPALTDMVEAALRRAVGMRMVADVPLGAFLSGGIDSSTVVALMQAQTSRPVKTFTIGFREASYNEATDAANVARHLGTEHHEIYLASQDCIEVITRLPRIYDEPFADSSQIPTTLVSEFTRRHVTVALSGDGGDELFGGYNRYLGSMRVWPRLSRVPRSARRQVASWVQRISPANWDGFVDRLNTILPAKLRVRGGGDKLHKLALAMDAASPDDLYRGLVSQCQRPEDVLTSCQEPPFLGRHMPGVPAELHYVERMMYLDLLTYLPSDILCKVDRASMAASLEVRVPFLDSELAQLAWNLPLNTKIHLGVGKFPLRRVLQRYVPNRLFERPKTGFGIPLGEWLRKPMRGWAESMLQPGDLSQAGFRPDVVRRQWEEHLSGRFNRQHFLWSVIMFQSWRKEFAT